MTRAHDVAGITDLASAKGDIYVATADNTPAILNVGVAYQQIVPDTTTASGLRWGDDHNLLTIMGAYL